MKKLFSLYTVLSLFVISLALTSVHFGYQAGQNHVWQNLTNSTQVILIHSDGKIISYTERLGPEWDHIKWQAWSIHDTNIDENIAKVQGLEDTVRQWLNDTKFESNQTRTMKIITHQ